MASFVFTLIFFFFWCFSVKRSVTAYVTVAGLILRTATITSSISVMLTLTFASTSNRGRDLLFLLFFLLSGKICCWSWVSSQMTFSWRLVQYSIRTILKATKDRNSICNQLVTSAILEIIEMFKITFTANVKLYHVTNFFPLIYTWCLLFIISTWELVVSGYVDRSDVFCTVFNGFFPKFGKFSTCISPFPLAFCRERDPKSLQFTRVFSKL